LDLDEVTKAASAVYDRLEKGNDTTLDRKEASPRIGRKEFSAAGPDHDGTLTKDGYLALVGKLFKKADTNGDETSDAKELHSKAGRALARLLR
jgi:hypothetical protein